MKAMILAAGIGSRLAALTTNKPKCLMDINGTPMLRLVAEQLADAGVKEVIINLHYKADQVQDYAVTALKDLFNRVEFSHEKTLLGTGGGLKQTAWFFEDVEAFLLVNADIYCSFKLRSLIDTVLNSSQILATLAVMNREDSSYLEFTTDHHLKGWIKARSKNDEDPSTIIKAFCGLQALSTRIFEYLDREPRQVFSTIDTYLDAINATERILGIDIGNETWFDMGTLSELEKLRKFLENKSSSKR